MGNCDAYFAASVSALTSYKTDFAFDGHGRLIEMTYPESVNETRLSVEYAYDTYGALSEVWRANCYSRRHRQLVEAAAMALPPKFADGRRRTW